VTVTPTLAQIAVAAVHLVPTVVWCALSLVFWQFLRSERRRLAMHWFMPIVCSLFAIHYGLHVLEALAPTEAAHRSYLFDRIVPASIELATVVSVPLFIHLLLHERDQAPRTRFLVWNYGVAAAVAATALLVYGREGGEDVVRWSRFLSAVYSFGGLAVVFVLLSQRVRVRGPWRQGSSLLEFRLADIVALGIAFLALAAMLIAFAGSGTGGPRSIVPLLLHTIVGVAFAVPVAARALGRVLPLIGRLLVLIPLVALVYFGSQAKAATATSADEALLWNAAGILLLLLLVSIRGLIGRGIDALLFGRAELRHAELQAVLTDISPELDRFECCRRACAGLARVMDLSGTAVILADGAGAVAHGELPVDRLSAGWPRDEAVLGGPALREIDLIEIAEPLRSALMETDVVRILAVRGRRRPWGHLLAAERLLARPLGDADEEAIASFASQLGLLLDASELLAHAVEVERSLAHAEKLAALGELSARIAHEIRNPVTAARSLAQQLTREPEMAFAAEHKLILAELERVERQIATLLRFARREEYRLVRTDLGALVAATCDDLRPQLASAGIEIAVRTDESPGRFDVDKMRQVAINLIENARDALELVEAGRRHLWVSVERCDGRARLRVADDGPGVPDQELAHLFEPFYSRKPQGTGLGLAVVRRTVEAHGGRISAAHRPGGGLCFDVDLPLGAARWESDEGLDPGRR
jgi:signal transduction histidine kinase